MAISLRAARVDVGLTQSEAAKKLKISKGTLINYEKYRTVPDIEKSKEIAALYERDVNEIIFFRK